MSSVSSASVEVMMRGLPRSNALGMAGFGAGGDDGLFVLDELLALLGFDAQTLRAFKIAAAVNDLHIALLREHGDAAAKLLNDGFLPFAQLGDVNFGRFKNNAAMGGFARAGNAVDGVQQRLGRDAAAIEADAAEAFVALDENDFFAEVGGVKRRRITARAAAHNYDFSFDWFHV